MPITVEAVFDPSGRITLLEPITVTSSRRAFLTVLDEPPSSPTKPINDQSTVLPTAGSSWATRFESLGEIGRGGMGFVHKVRHRETGRICCLKQLLPGIDKADLQVECRALGRLSHAGIVGLVDFDALADPPFFITEFVDGPTLSAFSKDRSLPVRQVLELGRALFDALSYAHRQGVIHRDLKPANIMIEHADPARPRILDFGLAIVDRFDAGGRLTGAGIRAGTFAYMAPEQIQGRQLTSACDVYAAGQMIWELVAGRRAFVELGASDFDMMEAKVRRAANGLQFDIAVPKPLADLVAAATRVEPLNRPGAQEALGTMANLLDSGA